MSKEFLAEGAKLPYDVAVCINHCCVFHGCKYGKLDCAVRLGEHPQAYPCEQCDEPDITITKDEYQRLLDDSRFLAMLQNYGVDNWEGWDDCVQAFDGGAA